MEENIHLIALQYRWPPGSWDDFTMPRTGRLWDAIVKRNEAMQERRGIDEEDLEA